MDILNLACMAAMTVFKMATEFCFLSPISGVCWTKLANQVTIYM